MWWYDYIGNFDIHGDFCSQLENVYLHELMDKYGRVNAMKIRELFPTILRETFIDISVSKLGIDDLVTQADISLDDPAASAIDNFVGVSHSREKNKQNNIWGGIMHSDALEDAYSDNPSEEGEKIKNQLHQTFTPVREFLQNKFGNTIKLYRGQENIDNKHSRSTLSWTSDPRVAAFFVGIEPWEMKLNPITDKNISIALMKYHSTGKLEWYGKQYVRTNIATENTNVDEYYYDIYDSSGDMITDGNDIEEELISYKEYLLELIKKREYKKSLIITANIPINDIIWITDRAGQSEFILHNQAGKFGYVDIKGKTSLIK